MKKTLLAAVGAASITREQVMTVLDDMVERGRMTQEEARKTADDIMNQGKREFSESKARMDKFYEDMLERMSVVSRERFEQLEARVAALEAKLDMPGGSVPDHSQDPAEEDTHQAEPKK